MNATCIVLTDNVEYDPQALTRIFSEVVLVVDAPEGTKNANKTNKDVKILFHTLDQDFSAQRNFALKHATKPWVFFLDQDESVSNGLQKEIERAIQSTKYTGYLIPRTDVFMGRELKHGETASVQLLRLAQRDAGTWERPVHEVWRIAGEIGTLRNPLTHSAHVSLEAFVIKLNRYTNIEATYRRTLGQKFSFLEMCLYPPAKFFVNYILKLGFLDGFPGLSMACMMSLHSLMVRVNLYEKK